MKIVRYPPHFDFRELNKKDKLPRKVHKCVHLVSQFASQLKLYFYITRVLREKSWKTPGSPTKCDLIYWNKQSGLGNPAVDSLS